MNIAIVLYDSFTALDAIGPYEVLSRLPGARVTFVATEAGPVTTDNGMLTVVAERSLEQEPQPDIVLVPGGPGEVVRAREAPCSSGCARWTARAPGRPPYAPGR